MNDLIEQLNHNNQNKWLVNSGDVELNYLGHKTLEFYQIFKELKQKKEQVNILIVETDILIFISAFLAGISAKCHLFLGNTQWQEEEWKQVFNLVNPDLIIESLKKDNPDQLLINKRKQNNEYQTNLEPDKSYVMIPTGGTSGKIKFAIHSWETLTNSVMAFANYFQVKSINSYCVLPLYHVSGLMQFIRSFLTNGKLNYLDYKNLKKSDFSSFNQKDYFISLVPTQLQYLITKDPQWLRNFHTILLGGAKPWADLLNLGRKYQLNLAPVYGMTETASQIVALKPQDFLQGNNSNGKVLSHSKIKIKNSGGEVLNFNQTGIITIESKSLCLGYYPHLFENNQVFVTDDLGYFDPQGYLYITGRNSQKIITGGENVNPTEVENVILATNLVKDICIIGVWDPKWGEAVTAIYVPINHQVSEKMIKESIKEKLALFKQPKYWFAVEEIPRNLQGKINYEQLKNFTK
jgi:o-succinylbenzoate---CoA ligase